MKSDIKRSTILGAAMACLSVALIGLGTSASAQDAPASAPHSAKQTRSANRTLSHNVRKALTKTRQLDSSNIRVLARNGVVSLEGTVPESEQIDRAGAAASSVSGVVRVNNNLTMREEGS